MILYKLKVVSQSSNDNVDFYVVADSIQRILDEGFEILEIKIIDNKVELLK